MLREHCFINTNIREDKFIGLKVENGSYQIHFPLCFELSESDEEVRNDIMLLFSILATYNDKTESDDLRNSIQNFHDAGILMSYLYVIQDFLSRGYYKETVSSFESSNRGKIDWPKTIKNKHPFFNGSELLYLDFITRKNKSKENSMITLIHMYCVFRKRQIFPRLTPLQIS